MACNHWHHQWSRLFFFFCESYQPFRDNHQWSRLFFFFCESYQPFRDNHRVAIVGMGCTKFGEHWDKGTEDLLVDAAYQAYESAGVGAADVCMSSTERW